MKKSVLNRLSKIHEAQEKATIDKAEKRKKVRLGIAEEIEELKGEEMDVKRAFESAVNSVSGSLGEISTAINEIEAAEESMDEIAIEANSIASEWDRAGMPAQGNEMDEIASNASRFQILLRNILNSLESAKSDLRNIG